MMELANRKVEVSRGNSKIPRIRWGHTLCQNHAGYLHPHPHWGWGNGSSKSHTICECKGGISTSNPSQLTTAIDKENIQLIDALKLYSSVIIVLTHCLKAKCFQAGDKDTWQNLFVLAINKMSCRGVISELTLIHAASIINKHKFWWFIATHSYQRGQSRLCSKTS